MLRSLIPALLLLAAPALVGARDEPDRPPRLHRRSLKVFKHLEPGERPAFGALLDEARGRPSDVERVVSLHEHLLNLRDLRAGQGELPPEEHRLRERELIREIDAILGPLEPKPRERILRPLAPSLQEAGYPVRERFPDSGGAPPRPPDGRGPPAPSPEGTRPASGSARKARQALLAGDFAAAEAESAAVLKGKPEDVEARLLLAIALSLLERPEEALFEIKTAERLTPPHARVAETRAFALNRAKRHAEAKEAADEAIRLDAREAWAWLQLAWAQAGLAEREESLRSLQRAAALQPRAFKPRYEAAQRAVDAAELAVWLGKDPVLEACPVARQGPGGGLLRLALLAAPFVLLYRLRRRIAAWVVRQGLGEAGTPLPPAQQPTPVGTGRQVTPSAAPGRIPTGYRLIRQIGAGGMGAVYEAEDISLERRVAIKRMRDEIRQDPRELERFLKEARTVAKLRHPNIIEIHNIVELDGELFLVFEFLDGSTLDQALAQQGRMDAARAGAVLGQICAALGYAHDRGIIHRDLKPSNVMLAKEGLVKVMDFGVARQAKDVLNRLSMTNTVAGTPPYMAPESETGIVRLESDLYSLAVCLYEMLTGLRPFDGTGAGMLLAKLAMRYDAPSRRVEGLPPALDAFFQSALHAEPEKRPRSAAAFAAAFAAATRYSSGRGGS